MTDQNAKYEATVSTGLEDIAKDEIEEKLHSTGVPEKGRVMFSSDKPVEDILKLRSIGNLFVVIYDEYISDDDMPTDSDSLESLLMRVGDKCDWETGLNKWHKMSSFKCDMSKILTRDTNLRPEQPNFRVSSKRYGSKHKFTSPEICSIFGHVIDTKFGWPIRMKEFDLEVMANFNENRLYIAITLTPICLDRRNIVETGLTTLKAATCYALLRLAKIQPGDIVVDPMAGSGAIPVECCAAWADEWLPYIIAGELKSIPLEKSRINMNIIATKAPRELLRLDVTSMPFNDNSIDVFVSDLPFGRRHGSKKVNKTLYPALMLEMARVARRDTGRAVLLTKDFKSMNLAHTKSKHLWTQKMCHFVKIGNLVCYIYMFIRKNNDYSPRLLKYDKS